MNANDFAASFRNPGAAFVRVAKDDLNYHNPIAPNPA
jgi:hypothetical protein